MRIATACKQCRDAKRKCCFAPGSIVKSACLPCQKRKITCSKAKNASGTSRAIALAASTNVSTTAGADADTSLLSVQEAREFIALYLRFVHDRPHSLFHIPSLWAELENDSVDECLILAICSIGCRFAMDSRHRSLDTTIGSQACLLFSQRLEKLSLSNVQTSILLANYYAAKRDNELEALYFGIANRTACILRLHETDLHDPPILRETKCRVWWSLFMADRWCPPALGLPREVLQSDRMLELPMDESIFQQARLDTEIDHHTRLDGLWKHSIMLVKILGPIQDLNLSLLSAETELPLIDQGAQSLERELDDWQKQLPLDRQLNDANLERHRAKGEGGTFVAVHLGFYHYSVLLYFQYLDHTRAFGNFRSGFAAKCRFNALSFSKLLHQARSMDNCHVVYLTVAHMTMVSSSVLLHMLLFGDNEEEIETARVHLVYNFEALMELGRYWPHVDHIIDRLLIFQNACMKSRHTHRIDKWMVRFLLEHALPFAEKVAEDDGSSKSAGQQFSPTTTRFSRGMDMLNEIFTQWHKNGNQ